MPRRQRPLHVRRVSLVKRATRFFPTHGDVEFRPAAGGEWQRGQYYCGSASGNILVWPSGGSAPVVALPTEVRLYL